ncbi:MAG: glycoside hydrolase family 130 protein [Myxococcales bacterium]|nr:glycoside hydrolase family 130 protein [Myxococcales bacterium]
MKARTGRLRVTRTQHRLLPDPQRVILRPYLPGEEGPVEGRSRVELVLDRILALPEEEIPAVWERIRAAFSSRHRDFESVLADHFRLVSHRLERTERLSPERERLIGAYFTHEYSIEGASLCNPSLVPAQDQSELPGGALRFIMSLRAVGEGHLSSIEFRSGVIESDGKILFEPTSPFVSSGRREANPSYSKAVFALKLEDLGVWNEVSQSILDSLQERFSLEELSSAVASVQSPQISRAMSHETLARIHWLATSNYEITFSADSPISERVIFPASPTESHGMEDARFVRFVEDDGSDRYYATYTAFDGQKILPQLIETADFVEFRVLTLNGARAHNKGMALFPRRIRGRFAMLSRHDNENIHFLTSDDIHLWNHGDPLQAPSNAWEFIQIGNCGSPIETEAGWLVLTHGVGPMRRYTIGAMLLDRDDPRRVIGRLAEPLLEPEWDERDGYVPNVVYTCGAIVHNGRLILPYGFSDTGTGIATTPLDELLSRLESGSAG